MTGLAQWLERIERLHPKSIELGLDRVREVARRLSLSLECVVITVGGTNGKGSTCAMLDSILRAAGYRVGLYTSPHLVAFNERARLDGVAVDDAALVAQFEAVDAARGEVGLTYFEFTTLAILRLFAQRKPDVAILEVGLGGRLDAVNMIDPDCAVVTSVDIDHTDYLGDTRESIGWEKAHIFRTGRPAICADPHPPHSLLAYAGEIDAKLWVMARDFGYTGDRQQWSYRGPHTRRNSLAYPALRGANQLLNAAAALAALEALRDRLPVSQQAVRRGLAAVTLAGRFQVLPGRPAVVLDVAHNPHAAAHLAQNLENMGFFPATWAVFGVMADKDVAGIVRALAGRVDHWLLVDLPGARAASSADLVALLAREGISAGENRTVRCFDSPREAYDAARGLVDDGDRILVFGSFLTVADVLDHLGRHGRPN
ncbi:MAG TPA: bifunctional tetrahydrofolate synthase/dihydrofolate synthase [Burkholderiaceae bacterium]